MNASVGKVYLVGAGPGDPALITLRALECLQNADVVLYDYLASPQVVSFAHPSAELVCLGRHGHGRLMSQVEINAAMIRHAREGRNLVRLKGGDPMIFARASEELAALESAGVPYEIVPGITAAQAASSHAGIPLTDRDDASCVALVTGRESSEKLSGVAQLDYDALAGFPGTLVFYMGVTTAPEWSRASRTWQRSKDACGNRATMFATGSGNDLHDTCRRAARGTRKKNPPARGGHRGRCCRRTADDKLVYLPAAVWLHRAGHAARFVKPTIWRSNLRNLGATVLVQPAIEITDPGDWAPLDAVLGRLAEFDWMVFSSSNGVEYFFRRLYESGRDARSLSYARLAAIGPSTVEALAQHHLKADLQPDDHYRAESLAAALEPYIGGKHVFVRAPVEVAKCSRKCSRPPKR